MIALVLLAFIVSDLAADASCDLPAERAGATAAWRSATGHEDVEPCASFCVPDCFCCSRSVGAAAAIAPPRPVSLTALDHPRAERWPEGVRPVVDRPPLPRG